ncbi:hypothetical protein BOO69_03005 [Sulfitobacter alexandrii]|uniref:NAD-dependent epimerase/dehydratase domain-containing protein n=1 Tax=Sulfitobacter alexandrii TaxID=1917485 RepID=A0A1J0WDV6_9RHOB|nr:NAD(P)-dependent oxidoreductase [Sulfitobacter alexandrii]APE42497.1 hypothetical protein BOO69_03005 [Sulfitobacter alexandrii]
MADRVLITGATGFLGAWTIDRLLAEGREVIATDLGTDHRRLEAIRPLPEKGLLIERCDVTDAAALNELVSRTRPGGIIHLAALQIPQCRENPALGASVNILGHINVLEAARAAGIGKVVYTSSIAAKPRGPANAPSNLYGVYKKTCEEISRLYWQDHGLPSLGLRPHIVYGVGRDDGETSAITRAIEAAALGRAYTLPFRTRSCFQYVGDVARIFARAVGSDWQGALLSDVTDNVISTDDILAAIRKAVPDSRIDGSAEERESPLVGFDTEPLRQVIGDWTETGVEDGVAQTVSLYRDNAARMSRQGA